MNEKNLNQTAVCLTALSQLDKALYSIKDIICGAAFPVRAFITDERGLLDENKLVSLSKELTEYIDIYCSKQKMFIHDSEEQFYLQDKTASALTDKQKQAYENFFYCALTALYDNKRPYHFAIDQFARRKVIDKSVLPAIMRTNPDSFSELIDMAAEFEDKPVGYRFYPDSEPFMAVLEGIYTFNGGKGGCCSRPLDEKDREQYLKEFDSFYPPDELDEIFDISDIEDELYPEKKLSAECDRYLNDETYKELVEFVEPWIDGLDSYDIDTFIDEIDGTWNDYMDFFADFHFSKLEDKYSYEDLKGYLTSIKNLLKEREKGYYELHSCYGWNRPSVTWSLEKYRQLQSMTEAECRKQICLLTEQKRKKLPDFGSFEKHFHDFLYTAEYLPDRQTRKDCVRNAVYLFLYRNEKVKNISALKDSDTLEYYLAMLDVCRDKIEQRRKRGDVL